MYNEIYKCSHGKFLFCVREELSSDHFALTWLPVFAKIAVKNNDGVEPWEIGQLLGGN